MFDSNKMITFVADMKKKDQTPKTREQIFAEKADNYGVCNSTICPLREHCLHSLLTSYKPQDRLYTDCVNLNNPKMQREGCPLYAKDEPVRMPIGLSTVHARTDGACHQEPPHPCLFPQALLRVPQRHPSHDTRCGALHPPDPQSLRLDPSPPVRRLRRGISVVELIPN